MNLELLKNFVTVVETDSFTEASRRFFVCQPCISKRISTLEKELGIQLIIRDKHSPHVKLTEDGKLLNDECRPLLVELDRIESKIQQMKYQYTGELKIYTIRPCFGEINNICINFKRVFPNSNLKLARKTPDLINESLSNGEIDIGVVFSFELPSLTFPYSKMRIKKDRFVAIFSNNHKFAKRSSISLDELKHEPLICMDPMPYKFIQLHGLTPSRFLNVPHETILLNVQENMGYSIAPRLAVILENNISMLEIEDLNETCDVYMVWKENNTNPMLGHFLDISRQL